MYCFKCPNSKLYPPSESKLPTPLPKNSKKICKGCGYDFGVSSEIQKAYRCGNCTDYIICSNCRLCQNGHQMFKCYSLRKKGNGGGIYPLNQYNCDFCGVNDQIDPTNPIKNFVWHCNSCEYDVCPKHFYETSLLVEQQTLSRTNTAVKGMEQEHKVESVSLVAGVANLQNPMPAQLAVSHNEMWRDTEDVPELFDEYDDVDQWEE